MDEDRRLLAFAILQVNWEQEGKGYLRNFLPFVAHCLKAVGADPVTAPAVRDCIKSEFALDLPIGVVDTLLKGAAKAGLVTRKNHVFHPRPSAVTGADLGPRRAEQLRRQEALITRFIDYCRSEQAVELDRDAATTLLLNYVEKRSLALAKDFLTGATPIIDGFSAASAEYLVASFVLKLSAQDPTNFDYLLDLLKGVMLSSVVYFSDPAAVEQRFKNLLVLFDTNMLIHALGYHGVERRQAFGELRSLLKDLGADIGYLPTTLAELQAVFDASIRALRTPSKATEPRSSLAEFCLENNISASELQISAETIEKDLGRLGLHLADTPPYNKDLPVDEGALEAELETRQTSVGREARLHDVGALSAVARFRQGKRQRRIEDAKAIFATAHFRLVAVSRQFFHEESEDAVPHCILESELTTLAWLKKPAQAPDLPRLQLLADCHAALNPDDSLWRKYLEEVERLQSGGQLTADRYVILRHSIEAKRSLLDLTRGDADAFTVGTVNQVLADAERHVKEEELRRLEALEAGYQADRERHDGQISELQGELASARTNHAEQRARFDSVAKRRASIIARVIELSAAVILLAGAVMALSWPFKIFESSVGVTRVILGIVLILAGTLTALHTLFDLPLPKLRKQLERRLEVWLREKYRKQFEK